MVHEKGPVDHSCVSDHPGHQVHWIQAMKSWEDQPVIDVSVSVREGLVYVEAGESDCDHAERRAMSCGGKWALWAVVAVC